MRCFVLLFNNRLNQCPLKRNTIKRHFVQLLVVFDKRKFWEPSWQPFYGQLALRTIQMMVQYEQIAL